MNGNSSGRNQIPGPGGGHQTPSSIPSLRIQADTPVPANPKDKRVPLPVLSTQRSIINQGKPTQNGFQDFKSPFATPRAPGPNGLFSAPRQVKQDFSTDNGFGLQGYRVNPRQKQNFGHANASSFANPNPGQQMHLPNQRLETQTPTPSEVSSIQSTPRNLQTPTMSMVSGQGSDRNLQTPISQVDKKVFLEPQPLSKGWNPYPALPHVGTSRDSDCQSDQQSVTSRPMNSWHTNGMIPPGSATTRYPSSSGSNSLSPHLAMDTSPTGSTAFGGSNFTTSPRHSAHLHSRATKRALSLSPMGSDFEFNKLIRTSPTSLVAYINGARSSVSISPQPAMLQNYGHFGHLIARNSRNSSGSGSANSNNRKSGLPPNCALTNLKSEPGIEVSDMQDYFQDIVSNQVVMPQNEIPYWEQRAFQDIQQYGAPRFNLPRENQVQQPNFNSGMNKQVGNLAMGSMNENMNSNMNNMVDNMNGMNVRPPPPYNQAVGQQQQQQQMSNGINPPHTNNMQSNFQQQPLQPLPVQQNNMSQSENLNNLNNNNINNLNTLTSNINDVLLNESFLDDGEVDENGEKQHICRWIDCNNQFKEQDELVRHIEKAHIDQRKGEDFTCFWAGCQRRYKPFNARYKLLIHMRVHSGEKPNKCTFEGCTKAFSRLENLKIHLRSHTGERPYICTHAGCTKAFSNSSDRAKHQRTHLDTKPYACSVAGCSKRYTDPSSLRKHVKNHNQKEPTLKKKMKREGEMSMAPDGVLNNCLMVRQLHVEGGMENGMGMNGTGSEMYPNFSIGNAAPRVIDHSPISSQNSPMANTEDSQNSDSMVSFSPAPPMDMMSARRPHPHFRRHMYPNMEMGMMPPAYPQADEMYQQWVENGETYPDPKMTYAQDVPPAQYTYNTGHCRMQNVHWQGNLEDFNIGGMDEPNVYAYDQGFGMGPEAQQLQLQMNAMDRPTSRLSGILADGGAT